MVMGVDDLGQRIALARQRAGRTQAEIAAAAGMDRSAVAKVENGTRRITALELARIAEEIGERIEWFFADPPQAVVSHRNAMDPGRPSPAVDDEIDRIVRAVEFVTMHDPAFQSALITPQTSEMPDDSADAERLATRTREQFGLANDQPVHGLSRLVAQLGVLTFVSELGDESADAASILLPTGAVALVNGSMGTGRRRLALAHELGHVLVADEYSVDWRIGAVTADQREHLLDRFARALLLPRAGMEGLFASDHRESRADLRAAAVIAASRFRVDMTTLARRLVELGLIDDTTAATVRQFRTGRRDFLLHDLVVADELAAGEMPQAYQLAVLRLYESETVSQARALDLLFGRWTAEELPEVPGPPDYDSAIWQYVS